jgi:hypothetical protein
MQVSSGEISPYEFTEEEKKLSNNQREDIKNRKKEYKKLLKRI